MKIIDDQKYDHKREFGHRQLWTALGAAFIIGNRGAINENQDLFKKIAASEHLAIAREEKRKKRPDPDSTFVAAFERIKLKKGETRICAKHYLRPLKALNFPLGVSRITKKRKELKARGLLPKSA